MIDFTKIENKVWYAEYDIIKDGNYKGFISKLCKDQPWEVFISNVFMPTMNNDQFKTLREAKKAVIKYFEQMEREQ